MSKAEKALARLQNKPKDFTWKEATALMRSLDFKLVGKKGGSHKKFYNEEMDVLIQIAKPHPRETLLRYQIDVLIEAFTDAGYINE